MGMRNARSLLAEHPRLLTSVGCSDADQAQTKSHQKFANDHR